jgi:TonB family protein
VIYTALDRDVTPPVELERKTPPWNPPAQAAGRLFRGVVQVVVDERGSVESAQLVWSLADFYDAGLLESARGWRFKPALRSGQPVTYRKIVEITMGPQQ